MQHSRALKQALFARRWRYFHGVDKVELARRLARLSGRTRGQAADEVDALVHYLLTKDTPSGDKGHEGPAPEARSSATGEKP